MNTPLEVRSRPLPGAGRLGVVSAYFTVSALVTAIVTVGMIGAVLVPRMGWQIMPSNPWVAISGGTLLTFGFARTTRLLRQRNKIGAQLAAVCLASTLAASVYAHHVGGLALAVSLLGIGLLASVWRHLE